MKTTYTKVYSTKNNVHSTNVYTPVPKKRISDEEIREKYMININKGGKSIVVFSGAKSELRKQDLMRLRNSQALKKRAEIIRDTHKIHQYENTVKSFEMYDFSK